MKFREKQEEWFGKRGLSWHISSVVFKDPNSEEVEVQSYAHLFDSCTQDWCAVASILEDLLVKLKSRNPLICQVYLRSDEAGCYHNNSLLAALSSIGERTGITVKRLDHSEPQHGKTFVIKFCAQCKQLFEPSVTKDMTFSLRMTCKLP